MSSLFTFEMTTEKGATTLSITTPSITTRVEL
jgi:hypothetical protein